VFDLALVRQENDGSPVANKLGNPLQNGKEKGEALLTPTTLFFLELGPGPGLAKVHIDLANIGCYMAEVNR